jgi:hypothetical protein
MNRHGYDARLSQSPVRVARRVLPGPGQDASEVLGTGSDGQPWRAIQYAAIDTLIRTEEG